MVTDNTQNQVVFAKNTTIFCLAQSILYFSGYKTEIFSFQNYPKNLDPSYKMVLDLWDCFGMVKLEL